MTLRVVTPPSDGLASLTLVKQQLEVDSDDRKLLINSQLATALSRLEGVVQRRYLNQVLEWSLPAWPCEIRLPVAPVAADGVISITYVDAAGATQILSPSAYVVSPCGPTVAIRQAFGAPWPQLGRDAAAALKIQFRAGEQPDAVALGSPHVVTSALMVVAWLFDNRGDEASIKLGSTGLPEAVESMILLDHWT